MNIAYDVATLAQLAAACENANDELHRAQNLIQEIHSHNDWGCKEKDAIDDQMRDMRKRIRLLCENQQSFLKAVRQVEDDLRDAERRVSGLFGGVESVLGKILSIPVRDVVVGGAGLLGFLFPQPSQGGSSVYNGGVSHGGGGRSLDDPENGGAGSAGSLWDGRFEFDWDAVLEPIEPVRFEKLNL